jgi:steroid 5-alpha reductase family enzyme
MKSSHNTRLCVKAKVWIDGKPKTIIVKGREAQTLLGLSEAGAKGIITLELSSTWALRLSAYIHRLRSQHGLDIQTVREEHDGGWHGRYLLLTDTEILEVWEA